MTSREDVIKSLKQIGILLELKGENVFRCRSYTNAARALESFDGDLKDLVSGDVSLKGIGKGMRDHIAEMLETGVSSEMIALENEIPHGLLEMLLIPGFGAKKARAVYEGLKIDTVDELEAAAKEGRLASLSGFGEKTEKKILEGIAFMRQHAGRFRIDQVLPAALEILEKIKSHKDVNRAELGGSIRRHGETVKDIDVIATSDDPAAVMEFFTSLPEVDSIIASGETKSSVRLVRGMACDLRIVTDEEFPFALMYFTGSKEHNTSLRGRAKKENMKLNEYGLFPEGSDKSISCKSEEDVFRSLGLNWIPPELREDQGEIKASEKNALPDLIDEEDICGILHVHSMYSDGKCSIRDHVNAAKAMGMQWLGMADHSQYASYAGGLTPDRVRAQWKEIDELNKELGDSFRVFKGIEADILPDGRVDYTDDDNLLEGFDFVIASVHSNFNMSEADMTDRVIRALENPFVTILGHPTGRLLLRRDAYSIDMARILDAAAENDVMIEINANPWRLDLDWRWVRRAIDKGILCPICPDAHAVDGLRDVYYGVGIARKGWCEARHIPNTLKATRVETLFQKRKTASE